MPLTEDEMDELARNAFGGADECEMLCHDLKETREALETAEGIRKNILLARVRAIQSRRRVLDCLPCIEL